MYLVGPYLFSGAELEVWLARRRAAALDELAGISAEQLGSKGADAVLRELRGRYGVAHTALHSDDAFFAGERELTAEERASINVSADDTTRYKALSIVIPFSGDEHLLTCTPSIYSAHQPQAEVKDGKITVTYFLSEIEEAQLENSFQRLIALIDRTLEVTQWQALGHNEKLGEALHGEIARRLRG
ncbi:MAG: hypothetical protein RL477_965 [Pseudomonadota bacterium]|jgi:hypothetical protein